MSVRMISRRNLSIVAVCSVLTIFVSGAAGSSQTRGVLSDQQILIQLEKAWDSASAHKDIAFLENVLADEYLATYDDGSKGDKSRELQLARDFNQHVDSSTLDDFVVKIYGDTAVVWFSRHLAGPRQGKQVQVHFRYTDVFVLRAGRWQCVASHGTKIPEQRGQQ